MGGPSGPVGVESPSSTVISPVPVGPDLTLAAHWRFAYCNEEPLFWLLLLHQKLMPPQAAGAGVAELLVKTIELLAVALATRKLLPLGMSPAGGGSTSNSVPGANSMMLGAAMLSVSAGPVEL